MKPTLAQDLVERQAKAKYLETKKRDRPKEAEIRSRIDAKLAAKLAVEETAAAEEFKKSLPGEKKIRAEFADDVAAWMFENWIDGPKSYHAAWWPQKSMAFCKKEPLTKAAIERMLKSDSASTPIGAYFIDADGNAKHVCIDIDAHKDGESAEPVLKSAMDLLNRSKIPFTVARSKGGKGYHLRIHFDKPLPARVARNLGLQIVKAAGLPEKTEVFPKQNELRPGEFGSQVWLPGSLFFSKKSNGRGSTLVDPATLEPIPFGEWLDYLRASLPFTEDALRDLCALTGIDLWKIPEQAKRRPFIPGEFTCEGVPEFKTVEQLVGFLSQHGIEVEKEKGAFGDWTDRLLLLSCPNVEVHGSARSDGAAVLFNADTGRVGYKCWHDGCAQFSWPKLLKSLGYSFQKKIPEPPAAEGPDQPSDEQPHHHHEGCGCDDDERERAPKDFRFTDDERVNMSLATTNPIVEGDAAIMKMIARCTTCCMTFDQEKCLPAPGGKGGHGVRGLRPDRCDDQTLCPNCIRALWRKTHRVNIEDNWHEEIYVVEVPITTPEEARAEVQRIGKLYKKNLDEKGRWFTGWSSVLYVFDPEVADYAKRFGLHGKIMSKDEYTPIVERVWLSISDSLVSDYRSGIDIVSTLQRHATIIGKGFKRTSAGKKAQKFFPWLSTTTAREQSHKKWQEAHPGLERGECDKITGHNPDGSPIYCKCLLHRGKYHRKTGEKIAEKRGNWKRGEVEPRVEAANARWIEGHLAAQFTADAT